MTLQFGSGGGAPSFATAPVAGTPSIAIGTGTFAGGAAPDFQGTSAIGVNMAAGYAQNLIDLQIAGVSKLRYSGTSFVLGSTTTISTGGGAGITFLGNGNLRLGPGTASQGVISQGAASQTADIHSFQDSVPVNQFGIANAGTGGAPLWSFRVAPVANAASMAQAHVGGASTGKAIQVIDNAGATIGWIQLLA